MEKRTTSHKGVKKVVLIATSMLAVAAVSFAGTLAWLTAQTNNKTNVFTSTNKLDIEIEEENWDEYLSTYGTDGQALITGDTTYPKDPSVTNKTTSDTAFIAVGLSFYVESGTDDDGNTVYKQISYDDFCEFATLSYISTAADEDTGTEEETTDGVNTVDWLASEDNDSSTVSELIYYYVGSTGTTTSGTNSFVYDPDGDDNQLGAVLTGESTTNIFDYVTLKDASTLATTLGIAEDTTTDADTGETVTTYRYNDFQIVINAYAVDEASVANEVSALVSEGTSTDVTTSSTLAELGAYAATTQSVIDLDELINNVNSSTEDE